MIIKEVIGENVLKYSWLELKSLPQSGLISISGKNESGKTSIGEMICFGLFGRTFSLGSDELDKLIKWGQDSCRVTLTFVGKDNQTYRVIRQYNKDNIHGAQLFAADADEAMTTGGEAVSQTISELVGFQYDEYIESFYLAQRELRTPTPGGNTIKVMAGIFPLEQVQKELEAKLKGEVQNVSATEAAISQVEEEQQELNYDEERLATLGETAEQCDSQVNSVSNFLNTCNQYITDYGLLFSSISTLKVTRVVALCISIVAVILSLDFLVAWWWAGHPHQLGTVTHVLLKMNRFVAFGSDNFLFLSGLFFVLCVVGGLLFVFLVKKERRLKEQTAGLTDLLSRLAGDDVDQLQTAIDQAAQVVSTMAATELNSQEIAHDPAGQEEISEDEKNQQTSDRLIIDHDMVAKISSVQLEPQLLVETTSEELGRLEALCTQGSAQLALVEEECEKEKQLAEKFAEYSREILKEQERLADQQHQVQVYEQGIELLQKGIIYMSRKFNKDVLEYTTGAIPLFTNGHYEHLKIDSSMNAEVFSREKHDFMDFEELSSGTQRQIMLALRLAMSQKLIHTASISNQYLFFDEPFAFFDKDRVHSTLNALPGISETIPQIWIVAQELDADSKVNVDIRCQTEVDELVMDCA